MAGRCAVFLAFPVNQRNWVLYRCRLLHHSMSTRLRSRVRDAGMVGGVDSSIKIRQASMSAVGFCTAFIAVEPSMVIGRQTSLKSQAERQSGIVQTHKHADQPYPSSRRGITSILLGKFEPHTGVKLLSAKTPVRIGDPVRPPGPYSSVKNLQ